MDPDLERAIGLAKMMNPDLSLRASLSAIEIDSYMNGKGGRYFTHTTKLSKELEDFSREEPDPLKSLMYANLLWPSWDDLKGKTTVDAYLQINLFAKELGCFEELDRDEQKVLLNNCIELSKLSRAHGNPYRMRLAA